MGLIGAQEDLYNIDVQANIHNLDIEAYPAMSEWDMQYQELDIKNRYKIVYVTSQGGEQNYAEYCKFSAERIGWEMQVYFINTADFTQQILDFDPDFILFSILASRDFANQITSHHSKKYFVNYSVL